MFAGIGKIFLKLIGGSRNERIVRNRLRFVRERINPLEPDVRALSDEQLKQASLELRDRLRGGESRDAVLPKAFALIREASRRARNHRQFDVQLVAGMVLDEGTIAEEATGEGKTIACYPAIYMAALEGLKVHVVTVNDYLVQRDAEFAQPIFEMLGLTVGYITGSMPAYGAEAAVRRQAYACDITYGTNSEFGFDYLRDNMKTSLAEQVQGRLDFAIIDEVDSILIDEARTPLIISGPAYGVTERFRKVDVVARELISRNRNWDRVNQQVEALKRKLKALNGELAKDRNTDIEAKVAAAEQELAQAEQALAAETKYYEVELDKKAAHLTHEGVGAAQDAAGVGSFYVGSNMEWPHLMEQALRAHLVFEKDKDYVVQEGSILIVDEFTGRILEGRQWSDGLHQAVEAKERVRVKEETQTLATITLQNFFKLYKKLAGMTGTAMTEAGEFMKIYKLDVGSVPTHRPVNRLDHNDRIYADVEAKFEAIVEEVKTYSRDMSRPVLVGTTSIEKSEKLSNMLIRTYGIEHEVLNARPENAAREADIVAKAGQQRPLKKDSRQMVGNVTIATNMAGRGTDIKLGPGVVWPHCKMPAAEKLAELGIEVEQLFPPLSTKCCIYCPQYDPSTNCAHCYKPKVDPDFPARGRSRCTEAVPCGLHIIGTERHEARRIDNQLRGRSGRQGDPGSSRFFLSLRDDLMAIFAGEWTLKVLGWLGLQGQDAIEDARVSKGIERAQKKVEERNFETRKNLLEYDEVMDYQRHGFYSLRQRVLEGRGLENQVKDMLRQTVARAVESYLDGKYAQRCIAEWVRQNLQIDIRPDQVHGQHPEDQADLESNLKSFAKDEAYSIIATHLGEYMDEETDRSEWDLKGLAGWAMSRFGVNLSQTQLRQLSPQEIETQLGEVAAARIDAMDLAALGRFLEEGLAEKALAEWAKDKFGIDVKAEEFPPADLAGTRTALEEKVETAYRRREIEYPVEYAMEMTIGAGGPDNVYALGALAQWANRKYQTSFTAEQLQQIKPDDIRRQLIELSEQWMTGGKLEEDIRATLGSDPSPQAGADFATARYDTPVSPEDLRDDIKGKLAAVGRQYLRREMTELERFVLLQIYDSSWKDHLLAMDHLKGSIGLRGYAEQDPKVAYKTEGGRLFQDMFDGVRDKVSDMIFKVRLTAGAQMANVYQISNLVHEQLSGYDHLAQDMTAQQQAGEVQKTAPIINETPRVGRNDPCPCGSGKKYKKCHGEGL